jgi:branched-subunit amino acid aminotransferase/4-amino-4-deoxychorismate lyase
MLTEALRETARVQDGRVPLLEHHLARLAAGGCDVATIERIRDGMSDAAAKWPEAYGRMRALVEPDGRFSIDVSDRPSTISVARGPVAVLVETDVPRLPPGAAKPADRSAWDAALKLAQDSGGDVAVLVDHEDHLIDGSQATIWLLLDGRLLTPPSPPALAGVSRAVVFEMAPGLGFTAEEAVLGPSEYERAEEAAFSTAVAGVVAMRDRGGPTMDALSDAFDAVFQRGGL